MEAGLPLVTLLAPSRKTRVAAGPSRSARLPKPAAEVGAGCPSFGGQRTVALARKQEDSQRLSKRLSLSIETLSFESAASHQPHGLAFSPGAVQLPGRSSSLRLQRYASPSKYKAGLPLQERGLTLPSSGRAYGTPLKSNVRRHATSSNPPR